MNYNHNAYMTGGVRIEPVFGRRLAASDDELETVRMRGIIERLTRDVLSKDEIIAVLNDDIARLLRSSESHLVNNLRADLRAKDQAIDAIEARYLRQIEDLRSGELARKQSRIDELEVENRNLRAANANTNNRNNATALQAELERTWAELERARGWR